MTRFASIADLRAACLDLPGSHAEKAACVALRESMLTKPPRSLGRLEEVVEWLGLWQGENPPRLDKVLEMLPDASVEINYYSVRDHDIGPLGRHYHSEWDLLLERVNILTTRTSFNTWRGSRIAQVHIRRTRNTPDVPKHRETYGVIEIRVCGPARTQEVSSVQ